MARSDDEKNVGPAVSNPVGHGDGSDTDKISEDAQLGVQKIEATTKVWTKTALIVAYVMCVKPIPAITSLALSTLNRPFPLRS